MTGPDFSLVTMMKKLLAAPKPQESLCYVLDVELKYVPTN